MGQRADAATKLYRVPRGREDLLHSGAIDAFAGKGAVQVNNVEPFETGILEGFRLGARIVVIDRCAIHLAQPEANALAILQINGGEENPRQGQCPFRFARPHGLAAAGGAGGHPSD